MALIDGKLKVSLSLENNVEYARREGSTSLIDEGAKLYTSIIIILLDTITDSRELGLLPTL